MTQRTARMYQRWCDLLFLHWPVDPAIIQATLPPGLSADVHHGQAYLGVVPFYMHGLRPRYCPPCPGISYFPELNLRTYVRDAQGQTRRLVLLTRRTVTYLRGHCAALFPPALRLRQDGPHTRSRPNDPLQRTPQASGRKHFTIAPPACWVRPQPTHWRPSWSNATGSSHTTPRKSSSIWASSATAPTYYTRSNSAITAATSSSSMASKHPQKGPLSVYSAGVRVDIRRPEALASGRRRHLEKASDCAKCSIHIYACELPSIRSNGSRLRALVVDAGAKFGRRRSTLSRRCCRSPDDRVGGTPSTKPSTNSVSRVYTNILVHAHAGCPYRSLLPRPWRHRALDGRP